MNVNTNGSLPDTVGDLARGRVRLHTREHGQRPGPGSTRPIPARTASASARWRKTVAQAKDAGLFVSLNFLFHPGVSDTEEELEALGSLIEGTKADFVQLRNLNLDPELYAKVVVGSGVGFGASMSLANFMKRLRKRCPLAQVRVFQPLAGPRRLELRPRTRR